MDRHAIPYYFTDKQLAERYNVHRTTIWRWVRKGDFPTPVNLSDGCTRWASRDVEPWEAQRLDRAS